MSGASTARRVLPVAAIALLVLGVLAFWGFDHLVRPVPRIDISTDPAYAGAIGRRFQARRDLHAIGVTMDRNYAARIDSIALVGPPGFSGPEVVARSTLPAGAVLEVVAVRRADSRLVDDVEYVVRRLDAPAPLEGVMVIPVAADSKRRLGVSEADFVPLAH
jgi:hypothetical protein